MSKKPKISANVVVYNEERNIKRCLNSFSDVVDEIILVHDGPCTDNTLKIAKPYTKKIYVRNRYGIAEPHRPFALAKSTGDWIFTIDADEVVSPQLRKNLRKLVIKGDKENIDGYQFSSSFYDKGIRITKGPLGNGYKLALFKKSKASILGIAHRWFKVSGITKRTNLEIEHLQIYNSNSYRNWFRKSLPRIRADARYRVKYGHAKCNFLFYLFKAPLWFVLYFMYVFLLRNFLSTKNSDFAYLCTLEFTFFCSTTLFLR